MPERVWDLRRAPGCPVPLVPILLFGGSGYAQLRLLSSLAFDRWFLRAAAFFTPEDTDLVADLHVRIDHAQAYCHPEVTMTELWVAGVGWAVFAAGLGIIYFWRAEARYGRG